MNLQEHIRRVIREEVGLMDRVKNFFSNKNNTPNTENKTVNIIVNFINEFFEMEETYSEENKSFVYRVSSSQYGIVVMKYIPKFKRLAYRNDFAEEIYTFIPDERLLEEDSELMGRVFEKLKNRKVDNAQNFTTIRL